MCGRYTLTSPIEDLVEEFGLSHPLPELEPSYNVAPGQGVAAVLDEGDRRRLEVPKWGLVPSWAKDPAVGSRTINARSETAAGKPSFKRAMKERRCLIVADGFYEWKKTGAAMQIYPVSRAVNSPSNDGPVCIEPAVQKGMGLVGLLGGRYGCLRVR